VAELTPQERLQPALLDRLTDDEPGRRTESREQRVLSQQRLRAALLRDLAWLLDTGHLETVHDLEAYPAVRRSVLNYGVPELTGLAIAGADTAFIERAVRQAIADFEPRIDPQGLSVSVETGEMAMGRKALVLRIEGSYWAQPAPQALYLKTEVDLDTGHVTVSDGR
jgi:type VI secretion system protein ImpF